MRVSQKTISKIQERLSKAALRREQVLEGKSSDCFIGGIVRGLELARRIIAEETMPPEELTKKRFKNVHQRRV